MKKYSEEFIATVLRSCSALGGAKLASQTHNVPYTTVLNWMGEAGISKRTSIRATVNNKDGRWDRIRALII